MIGATFCSGIGAPEVAAPWVDWQLSSEIEPFPRAVLAERFGYAVPEDQNQGAPLLWGDMASITPDLWREHGIPLPNIIVAGTPCFTSGHMVLTDEGYKRIENIAPGDLVATHKGRFRRVLRIGSKSADVGVWKAVGVPDGIVCTPDHPFFVASDLSRSTRVNGKAVRISEVGEMEWRQAADTPGSFWAGLQSFEESRISIPQPHGLSRNEVMCLLGWFFGSGWIRTWASGKKAIVLGLSPQKVETFRGMFPTLDQADVDSGTTQKIAIGCTELCEWIETNLEQETEGKSIPGVFLGDPDRKALLKGYIAANGTTTKFGFVQINSVSESLARGAAAIGETVGYAATISLVKTPNETVIEGRQVSQQDYYCCRLYNRETSRKSRSEHGYLLRKVQSFTPTNRDVVFNIEVAEDNSFVLNGAVVHNCQSFSVAGLRKGLKDDRGNLTLKFVELCHDIVTSRPDGKLIVLWENVPGVLSDKGNAFGAFLGGIVGAMDALSPPADGSWPGEGMVEGPRARAAWAVLDAQYFGVAQRRRRVFVVIDFGNAVDPAAVLFEPESLRGNSPTRSKEGQGITRGFETGPHGGGFTDLAPTLDTSCKDGPVRAQIGAGVAEWPAEVAPTLNAAFGSKMGLEDQHALSGAGLFVQADVANALRGEAYDASEDGTGRGTPLVPVAGAICKDSFSGGAGGRPEGAAAGHFIPVAFDCKAGGKTGLAIGDITTSLRGEGHGGGHAAIAIQERAVSENPDAGPDGAGFRDDDAAYTLEARTVPQAVAFVDSENNAAPIQDLIGALTTGSPTGGGRPLPAVAFDLRGREGGATLEGPHDTANIRAASGGSSRSYVASPYAVRRLTPTECHRLQGFKDDHCEITYRGKPAADGPQYKALGNSMAVPVVRWIMDRIRASAAEQGK